MVSPKGYGPEGFQTEACLFEGVLDGGEKKRNLVIKVTLAPPNDHRLGLPQYETFDQLLPM
jgi:hypothetical protein